MEETSIFDKLNQFGLTRQETRIYVCLYKNGELTGYEVAKQTGISRSNVYSGLSGLVDKGAAYLMEGTASRYLAVPINEFCDNKIRSLSTDKEFLIKHMPGFRETAEGYITIESYKNIYNKIVNMMEQAEQRIYFSASIKMMEKLEKELIAAVRRKIKLVLIPDNEIQNKEIKAGCIFYLGSIKEGQVRLIIDSCYALTGELAGSEDDTCLYTGQKNFINVFKEALSNEIKLIQLTEEAGRFSGQMEEK